MSPAPWRLKLLPTSFRGIGLEVESRDLTGGRNIVTHAYPNREEVLSEDLGRKEDGWSVDGYVWGLDYLERRDALIKALREPGAGEYVDHWGTRHWVMVKGWSCREAINKGGWATFRLDLVEAGTAQHPTARPDTAAEVEIRAEAAAAPVAKDFAETFTADGAAFVADDALSTLGEVQSTVSGAAGEAIGVVGRPLATAMRNVAAFKGAVSRLIGLPSSLASQVQGMLNQVLGLRNWDLGRFNLGLDLADFGGSSGGSGSTLSPLPAATATSTAQLLANRQAIVDLVRHTALIDAARTSSRLTYATREEAVAARDALTRRFAAAARRAGPNSALPLRRLQAAVIKDITTRGADLARLSEITPQATLPGLVLAHRLYGDARRAGEILSRNPDIANPLFIPGGRPLKVLADG